MFYGKEMSSRKRENIVVAASCVLAVGCALAIYGVALWFGNLNQDEGWYLYAARSVAQGRMPYRDFFFTQGPLLPYIYGALAPLWASFGILGGRVVTALLGLCGCFFAAGLARRSVVPGCANLAWLLAFAMTGCNLYHAYFTTIPKTYALASALLLGGFRVLTLSVKEESHPPSRLSSMWAVVAGLLVAGAVGVRISLGALMPVVALALLVTRRRTGAAFFWFTLGGGLGLALVYGPMLLIAPDAFVFSQSFHTARGGHDLMMVAGSLARIARAYPLLWGGAAALIVAATLGRLVKEKKERDEEEPRASPALFWAWIWLAAWLPVFLLQLCSPHPYDDYQTPIMGVLAASVGAWLSGWCANSLQRANGAALALALALLTTLSSPLLQEWFMIRVDRFWVVRRTMPDLAQLRQVGREIKALSGENSLLLTQDTYLAVETGMSVPPGMEMGPFCYFPELGDEEARRYHVLNRNSMRELLAHAPAKVAAVSGYGFAIAAPHMRETSRGEQQEFATLLSRNYDLVQEVEDFGHNSTRLSLMLRRKTLESAGD